MEFERKQNYKLPSPFIQPSTKQSHDMVVFPLACMVFTW